MAIDIKKIAEKAAKMGRDFTKTTTGGGEYAPPAAGPCNLRFVGYFEIGRHKEMFQAQARVRDKVQLVFELSGKPYPPKQLEDGTLVPVRMTIIETLSNNVKANIVKLFNKMNYNGNATHFAQLLGGAYRGRVYRVEKERDGQKVIYASLRNEDGYSITPPVVEVVDEETGDVTARPLKVAEPLTDLKLFLWDDPDMAQWASIYIEGEFAEQKDDKGKVIRQARSKNVIQEKIKRAENWSGSPMQVLLDEGALEMDDDDPEVTLKKAVGAKDKPSAKKAAVPIKQPAPKQPEPPSEDEALADDEDDPLAHI